MLIFPIICGIILILIIVMFSKKPKKEKIKPEVIPRERQPVIIELIPKGTNSNPVRCIVNDTVYFKVFGYGRLGDLQSSLQLADTHHLLLE